MTRVAAPLTKELFRASGLAMVRTDYPAGLQQDRHWHEYESATLLLRGSVEETVGQRMHDGDVLGVVVKCAGVEHACRWGATGGRTLSLVMDAGRLAESAVTEPAEPWAWVHREAAARALLGLYQAGRQGNLSLETDDLLLALRASVVPRKKRLDRTAPPWLTRACDAMRDASPERIATRDLARDAGVHPVHFARVFLRHMGCSPTEYARWLRLRAAAGAIAADSTADIASTPYRCGYYDHAHLCREFRRSLHLTPTLLRSLSEPVCA